MNRLKQNTNKSKSVKTFTLKNIWTVSLVMALALIGWYIATETSWLRSEARWVQTSATDRTPFRTATIRATHHYYANIQNTSDSLRRQDAYSHFSTQFSLRSRQTLNSQLEVQLTTPRAYKGFTYTDPQLSYRRITESSACSAQLFSSRSLLTMQSAHNRVAFNLGADDYNAYFCFRARVKMNHERVPSVVVERLFVTAEPIHATGLADYVSIPSFREAEIINTHYDWGASHGVILPDDHSQLPFYVHLDNYFKLTYGVQAGVLGDDVFTVRIHLPGKLVRRLAADVQSFAVEEVRYSLVSHRDQCNRRLFTHAASRRWAAHTELFLAYPPEDRVYCLRVQLKGDIRWRPDTHPYRIFYLD